MHTQDRPVPAATLAKPNGATPLMQRALGEQWHELPIGLQQHYSQRDDGSSDEQGWLTISYPRWMQWPLTIMHYFGALLNKAGNEAPTQVSKHMDGDIQRWARIIDYPDGTRMTFDSYVTYSGGNTLTEHVNRLLALRMAVSVRDGKLYYEGRGYVLKLGKLELVIPEWLALGYNHIEEEALADDCFRMNFWLRHPLFGELFRYQGEFNILSGNPQK